MFKKIVLLLLLSLAFSVNVFADQCIKMRYINGIGFTKRQDVIDLNNNQIKPLLSELSSIITIEDPLFNSGNGLSADAMETYYLKWHSGEFTFDVFYKYIVIGTVYSVLDVFKNPFNPQYQNNLKKLSDDLANMIAIAKSDIDSGCNLILLPHSEGNLFAKAIVAEIGADYAKKIIIYGIALPTTTDLADDYFTYRTSNLDKLMSEVGNIATPNFFALTEMDKSGYNHGLVSVYLNGDNLGSAEAYDRDVSATKKEMSNISSLEIIKLDLWRIYLFLTNKINHPPNIYVK